MQLFLGTILEYLKASAFSRCFIEGEATVNAGHIITCGVKSTNGSFWTIEAFCLQTSALKSDPHEITGTLKIENETVLIQNFACSCKAGQSGCCKHISAALLYISRAPIEELTMLSSTDTTCSWGLEKPKALKNYEPQPLKMTECFRHIMSSKRKIISETDKKAICNLAKKSLPTSAWSRHMEGRRNTVATTPENDTISNNLKLILENAENSTFIENLQFQIPDLQQCCSTQLKSLYNYNKSEVVNCKQTSRKWKAFRKTRITGSTCYSVYTFQKPDWSKFLNNFFHPKPISTKEMKFGTQQEPLAARKFLELNPQYKLETVGIIICHKYPWLGYSPDGIILKEGRPTRLLEIKCPYLGKMKDSSDVLPTLKYLNEDLTLKKRHKYYAQVQLGMALLNLSFCDFVIYFSHEDTYLHIEIPLDIAFVQDLISTVSQKYFFNMIHFQCEQKE